MMKVKKDTMVIAKDLTVPQRVLLLCKDHSYKEIVDSLGLSLHRISMEIKRLREEKLIVDDYRIHDPTIKRTKHFGLKGSAKRFVINPEEVRRQIKLDEERLALFKEMIGDEK
jgi:DNA-binding transcriptional regulator GbsR (MarR family)